MMMSRSLGYIAIGLAAVLSTAGAAGAAYFGIAKHVPVVSATPVVPVATPAVTFPPLADRWVQLDPLPSQNPGTLLDVRAKHWRLILDLSLPAGPWILHSDETVVNTGPADFVRCVLAVDNQGQPQDGLIQQTAYVGGTGARAIPVSETAATTLPAAETVGLFCDHDTAAVDASSPYVDPGADLWAHQSASLITTHMVP
jgi:hypothetical protein